jgi:hypothetical protein
LKKKEGQTGKHNNVFSETASWFLQLKKKRENTRENCFSFENTEFANAFAILCVLNYRGL